jgi:hypothetical protein
MKFNFKEEYQTKTNIAIFLIVTLITSIVFSFAIGGENPIYTVMGSWFTTILMGALLYKFMTSSESVLSDIPDDIEHTISRGDIFSGMDIKKLTAEIKDTAHLFRGKKIYVETVTTVINDDVSVIISTIPDIENKQYYTATFSINFFRDVIKEYKHIEKENLTEIELSSYSQMMSMTEKTIKDI